MSGEKKKRGARLPFGKLNGVWSELARTYREMQAGRLDSEDAKARSYVISIMLGVVDRLQAQRELEAMREDMATLRESFEVFKRGGSAGKVISVRPILNGHGSAGA